MDGYLIHRVIHHLKNGSFFRVFRRTIYVKRNLKKAQKDEKKYLENLGKITLGYKMNLDNPQSFNEKLNWYKLNYSNDLMINVVDKIYAKEYVKEKGLEDILINTIKTYNDLSEVNLDDLPDKFVIKNTEDSGGVYVCKDKSKISIQDIKKKLENKNSFISYGGKNWALENSYNLKNRIIVEELVKTEDGHAPWDYKFFCFNGKPRFLFVGSDRDTEVCFDFYDINFNHLEVKQGHPNSKKNILKPEKFDEMLKICEILSKDFPQVRVDLYNVSGKIYFGELTFFHFAGLEPFKPRKWDYIFGEFWDLSNNKGE